MPPFGAFGASTLTTLIRNKFLLSLLYSTFVL